MKKLSLVLAMVLFSVCTMYAQRTITGTVIDDTGESLIGASVLAKGSSVGTVTDIDGSYSLSVPDGTTTLVVSYTGYATQEIELGASNTLDVTLSEGLELTEVVVTGLGIKKEKKALGYGVTTLGSADVELKPEADVARVLRGKVPGVNITSTSGLAGSGTNVIIRGYSSITGTNQPLFVVDGVPFNSDTNNDRDFAGGGATASSRFLDLDPNNIAEISILKGLSATVLYGEAGRNGVVLVTTKSGNAGADLNKKMEVTVSQSIFQTQAASIPNDQDQYGNGWQNAAAAAFSNWGAPFNQPNKNGLEDGTIAHPYSRSDLNGALPQYLDVNGEPVRYNYQAYDNLEQFFKKGLSSLTSVGISNNVAPGTRMNFNYALLSDEGFTPDRANGESSNNFRKHNFGMGIGSKLSNGININGTFNFISSKRNTPPATPIYSSNPRAGGASLFSNVLYTPRSVDLFGLEYENPVTRESIYYRGGNDIQHPLWTVNNINENEDIKRFFGSVGLSYDLTDALRVKYQLGMDTYTQGQQFTVNKGGGQIPTGAFGESNRVNFLQDHTLSLAYDQNLNDDLNLDFILGANARRETRKFAFIESVDQFVYGLFTHENFVNGERETFFREENTLGAFASATLGFRSFLYLNLQGRNDWTSTLEEENRSIFYPSASLSFIASEAIPGLQNNDVINYLKVRVGYGTSAGYPDPYKTRNILGQATNVFVTNDGTIVNINTIDNVLGNTALTPELHRELELGIESKFLKNRLGIDLSLYDKQSTDLLLDPLFLDPSTGYRETTVNAAQVENRGIELGVNVTPVRSDDFYVNLGVNFTKNENLIISLAEGLENFLIPEAGDSDLGNFAIAPIDVNDPDNDPRDTKFAIERDGQYFFPYGVIQGSRIQRTEDGTPIIGADGLYQGDTDIGVIGDPNPDYLMSTFGTVAWKGIALRAQFDYVRGGDIWASTPSTLYSRGILEESGQFDRFVSVVVPGVVEQADGTYVPNTTQVTPNEHFWRDAGVWFDENRMFDGTTLRLREVSLSFELPKRLLDNTPLGNASFIISGQNLWYRAFNIPAGANFDPEVLSLGVGNGQGFDFVTGPTSKKIGGTLRITF